MMMKPPGMKLLSKSLLAIYLITLVWLVLFKLSFDLGSVLVNYQARSLNLIPFIDFSRATLSEMISNIVVFVPFGLLLSVNLKQISLWRRLTIVLIFSLATEGLQYVLAIGTSDITDVIMNTAGGLIGLALYELGHKYIRDESLDRFITIIGTLLFIGLILLRVLVLKVRY